MRSGYNWTVGGIPTAQIASAIAIAFGLIVLIARHLRPGPSVAEIEAAERAAVADREPGEPSAAAADEPGVADGEPSAADGGDDEPGVAEGDDRPALADADHEPAADGAGSAACPT
jgi:hypothetical protein